MGWVIVENQGKAPTPVAGEHLYPGERRRVRRAVFKQLKVNKPHIVEVKMPSQANDQNDDRQRQTGQGDDVKLLEGKRFVIAGSLPNMTHQEAAGLIEENGGQIVDRVDINLDYLVAGANPGERLTHAKGLSVEVLDEAGLLDLIGK